MAIANSDGSIILSTRVDTTGLVKGMNQISLLAQRTGEKINLEFLFAKSAIDKLALSLSTVQSRLLLVLAVKKLIDFSNASAKVAIQTEASVQRLADIYGEASKAVGDFIDQNSKALGLSKASGASIASTYGNLLSVWADQATNAELTNALLNQTAVVASKTGRTTEDVAERIRSGLLGNTEAIEDLGINVNIKTIEITDAFKRIADGRSWEQLNAYEQSQVRTLAILEQSTKKYGNQVEETAATTRNRYDAAYQDFQNSWGNIVNKILLPVLEILTQIFDIATRGLNALSGGSGQVLENTQLQEENTNKTAENIEEQTKNQKDLNKEMKKTLAGFDDIQILSANTADNTSGDGNLGDLGLGDIAPDGSAYVEETSKMLEHIMRIAGGALLALGLILLISSPAKGWAIAFIIAGASVFGVSAAASIQEASDMGVGAVISTIMGMIGDALIAIGVVLLFKGSIAWGIAFIIAGAAFIGVEYFATSNFNTNPIANMLVKILGIAGTALLALGLILCVFGIVTPLSLTLIAVGAISLVSASTLSSNAVVEAIQGTLGVIMAIAGASLLAIGIILCCTGVAIPLGIALIVAGAISLGTPIALNWDYFLDMIKAVGEGIKTVFVNVWEFIKLGFKAMVNLIVDMLNLLIDGLNILTIPLRGIGYGISKLFGSDVSWSDFKVPHIPRLAQGAVIPPNSEFLAVLGDQKSGTNIEAPLDTIVEAMKIALQSNGGNTGSTTVVLELDGNEFGRAVIEQGKRENRRIGTKLVIA